MAETASPLASPPTTSSDRRKLQNRIAQRRFRQKKAMEARAAQLAETNWQELLHIPPNFGVNPYGLPPSALSAGARTPPGLSSVPLVVDQDVALWDGQLFGDVFFGHPQADLVTPIVTAPPPLSPPSSISSSSSPGHSCQPNEISAGSSTAVYQPPPQAMEENAPVHPMFAHSPSVAGADSGPRSSASSISLALATPSPPGGVTEQARAQLRAELAAEWKMSKTNHPTWSQKNEPWEPLLHTAAKKGNCEIVQMLLDHNADINERNGRGMTALHLAIEFQQEDVIMLLLRKNIDINAVDNEGRTALSMAVANNCESGVRLFLLHGANPMLSSARQTMESP